MVRTASSPGRRLVTEFKIRLIYSALFFREPRMTPVSASFSENSQIILMVCSGSM